MAPFQGADSEHGDHIVHRLFGGVPDADNLYPWTQLYIWLSKNTHALIVSLFLHIITVIYVKYTNIQTTFNPDPQICPSPSMSTATGSMPVKQPISSHVCFLTCVFSPSFSHVFCHLQCFFWTGHKAFWLGQRFDLLLWRQHLKRSSLVCHSVKIVLFTWH